MAPFKINSIEFVGERFASECVVTYEGGTFRFDVGHVTRKIVKLIESCSEFTISLDGEYGAEIHIDSAQMEELKSWHYRNSTLMGC